LAKALEGKNVKELLSNVGAGGGAPAAGGAVAAAPAASGAAAAEEKKEEKKEEEKEESDDDMVRSLPSLYTFLFRILSFRASVFSTDGFHI
jgi:ribosomal protein L12E/L44/L45/RPP1/RPP2